MFSICAFFRKFLHGLWSFSLKCARRLSQTQTLPRDFLQKLHPGVESPSSLDDATLECHHISAPWEVHWHPQTARRGEKQSLPAEAKEGRLGNSSNFSWNVWNEDAGPPLPVWNKKLQKQDGCSCWEPSQRGECRVSWSWACSVEVLASKIQESSVVSVFCCGSASGLYRARLSTLQHEKMSWCYCWWPPTY